MGVPKALSPERRAKVAVDAVLRQVLDQPAQELRARDRLAAAPAVDCRQRVRMLPVAAEAVGPWENRSVDADLRVQSLVFVAGWHGFLETADMVE
jgi:hypothetical protein